MGSATESVGRRRSRRRGRAGRRRDSGACATRRSRAAWSRRTGPHRIAVAIDVRDGLALGRGLADRRRGHPRRGRDPRTSRTRASTTFEATAIERDGLLGGPDLDLLERLVGLDRGDVIASGGIASLDDIRAVRALGCAGAILGRALYEGRIDLRSGHERLSRRRPSRRRPTRRPAPRSAAAGRTVPIDPVEPGDLGHQFTGEERAAEEQHQELADPGRQDREDRAAPAERPVARKGAATKPTIAANRVWLP